MKADPGNVFGALFVGSLIGIGSSFATGFLTGLTGDEAGLAVRGITTVFDYIVQAFMSAGMTHFSLKVARGEPYAFGDIFSGGKWFLPVLVMNVLITLGVAFGMLFLIVPGIFLALAWSLSLPAAVDRDLGPMEAMTESFKLTAGHRGSILVLVLLLCGIGILGLCACGFGLFAALAIAQLAFAWVYVRISGRASSEAPPMMPGF